jgi:ketosteroid isomerase-like protein
MPWTGDTRLETWTKGALFIAEGVTPLANKAMLEQHFAAEWGGDIEGTMATIHPDNPWQRIPALGLDLRGVVAVRDYYLARFGSWPGPAMPHFDRTTVTDTCIIVEGTLRITPKGAFAGRSPAGRVIAAPAVIVVDFRDGLIVGETVYADSAALRGDAA